MYGTAGHLLKIWFALKHMGLEAGSAPVEIDTGNSTPALKRLFSFGDSSGRFYIPFAHTPRYLTVKRDASRSIIQTNVQRWASSGSVVTCDPTEYMTFQATPDGHLRVAAGRRYPLGLGIGESGFALEEGQRVSIPLTSFAVWYGRQTDIPSNANPTQFLIGAMVEELHLSEVEKAVIFVDDDLAVRTRSKPLSAAEIYSACEPFIESKREQTAEVVREDFKTYAGKVKSMVFGLDKPLWLRTPPEVEAKRLLDGGTKALLLYGPPRTGKTRFIDSVMARGDAKRATIQIHDGWGYDHLVEGFKPDKDGRWSWVAGPLKADIEMWKDTHRA